MKKLNDNMMKAVVAGKAASGLSSILSRRYKMLRMLNMLFARFAYERKVFSPWSATVITEVKPLNATFVAAEVRK